MGGMKENTVTTAAQNKLPLDPPAASQAAQAPAPAAPLALAPPADLVSAGEEPSRALSAFASEGAFNTAQRMARALSSSSLVPTPYQNNIPNTLIAMELANRIGASVFMVMQNLDVIHGNPGWRAKFLIATVNSSGRFTPFRFRFQGKEGTDEWGCRAVAKDRSDGEECVGPLITIGIAKAEGWYKRNGSKWQTMPELMLHYRSAAFWTRIFAPELSLGMQTAEEIVDTVGYDVPDRDLPGNLAPGNVKALEAELLGTKPVEIPHDPITGEVGGPTREPGDD
jgi:hypothetical protein